MSPEQSAYASFTQTRWTLIVSAQADDALAKSALEELCRKYWDPLYAFVRRSGRSPEEAEDLTQGFFAHLLQRSWLEGVEREKGRFRTFLLRCLTNYLTNEWRKENGAMRRPPGGFVPLEVRQGETRYVLEPVDQDTPEKLFQRRWVATLVEHTKTELRSEWAAAGKLSLYEQLAPHLAVRADIGFHAALAAALGLSEGALRATLSRMRRRFRELLRRNVAETVSNPAEVDQEIRQLFTAWG